MLLRSHISRIALTSVALLCGDMQSASAGPLIDWLFGRRAEPAYPVGSPVPIGNAAGFAPYTTGYAPAYSAYSPGYSSYSPGYQNAPAFSAPGYAPPAGAQYMPGAPSTYSNVPSFRTNYYRAPVTYYRPVLATDPTTGAQIVRMSPCTSYEYQTQRIPTLGQSVYYGNYGAPVAIPAPAAGPTYTLPQGGIPLSRSLTPPITTRGYGAYTTLQPPMPSTAPTTSMPQQPAGQYQTTPYGTTPYYGTTTGGCSGGYATGGTYPPQGYQTAPPSYGTPPGLTAPPSPMTAPGIYPPADQPAAPQSYDPANTRPALPTSSSAEMRSIAPSDNTRSKLKHITQAERDSLQSTASQDYEPARIQNSPPSMRPIPVPSDFDAEQHWTPGLLRDEDLTAQKMHQQRAQLAVATAGQGKRIQWASFEDVNPAPAADLDDGSASLRIRRRMPVEYADGMRPIDRSPRASSIIQQPATRQPASKGSQEPVDRFPTSNWKAVR